MDIIEKISKLRISRKRQTESHKSFLPAISSEIIHLQPLKYLFRLAQKHFLLELSY